MILRLIKYLKPQTKYIFLLVVYILNVAALTFTDVLLAGMPADTIFTEAKALLFPGKKPGPAGIFFGAAYRAPTPKTARHYFPSAV